MRTRRHRPTSNRMKIRRKAKSPAKRQRFAGLGQNRNRTGSCSCRSAGQSGAQAQRAPSNRYSMTAVRAHPSAVLPAIHRTLQVAAARIAQVALATQGRLLAALVFLRRRRRRERHLRMFVQAKLFAQDTAGHTRRILRERKRRNSDQQPRGQRCRGEGNGKFHGGMTLERRACWNVDQAASVAQIPHCCIAVRSRPRYRELPSGKPAPSPPASPVTMLVSDPHAAGS